MTSPSCSMTSVFGNRSGWSNAARYSSNVIGARVIQWFTFGSRRYRQVGSTSCGVAARSDRRAVRIGHVTVSRGWPSAHLGSPQAPKHPAAAPSAGSLRSGTSLRTWVRSLLECRSSIAPATASSVACGTSGIVAAPTSHRRATPAQRTTRRSVVGAPLRWTPSGSSRRSGAWSPPILRDLDLTSPAPSAPASRHPYRKSEDPLVHHRHRLRQRRQWWTSPASSACVSRTLASSSVL